MNSKNLKKRISKLDVNKQFPDWIWEYNPTFVRESLEKMFIKFNIRMTLGELVQKTFIVGNEQRPQATLLGEVSGVIGGKKGKKLQPEAKEKWDKVLINAIRGEIMDGPLLGIILNFNGVFIPNWLHRFFMFRDYHRNIWEITTENHGYTSKIDGDEFNNYDFMGLKSNFNFNNGFDILDKRLWKQPIDSSVYFYYGEHFDNLKNKADHFIYSNDGNLSDNELLHSIDSSLMEYIKERFGYRYGYLEKQDSGIFKWCDTKPKMEYEDIRENCPLEMIKMRNIKPRYVNNERVYDTGRKFDHAAFQQLKPFMIGTKLLKIYDDYFHSADVYGDIDNESLHKFYNRTDVLSQTYIEDFENRLIIFNNLYDVLHDINKLFVPSKKDLFQFGESDIIKGFHLYLELDRLGNFGDNWDFELNNNFYSELVGMLATFSEYYGYIKDEDSYYGLSRSIHKSERRKKMMVEFYKVLCNKTWTKNYLDEQGNPQTITFDLNLKHYLNSNFRFIQPMDGRVFPKEFRAKRYKQNGKICEVTGHQLSINDLNGHHIIWYTHGGPNYYPNNMMIKEELNKGFFQESNCDSTSDGIEKLIKSQSHIFTQDRLDYWVNGALDELKEYENNPENYYWPTEKTS